MEQWETIEKFSRKFSVGDVILRYSSKKEQWETIGNFSQVGDTERLFVNKQHRDDIYRGPIVCSHPCQYGYAKSVSDDRCCWICTKCSGNQYSGEFGCMSCPHGSHPNNNKSNCTPIHIDIMSFNDPAAIGTLTVSSIGIAACIVVIVVFTINRETPLVKATDLKLSLLLVFSLILSYGSSAAFLAKPSPISCGLIRYLLGLCYTLQYATLLTKTIRIYRLFQAKSPEKKKFINSRSSITLTLLITFFHVLGLTAWIIFDRPETRVDYDEDSGVLICDDADNYSYAISLSYSVALLMTCVYFAVKTRKIPDGFKETRFIAICSYTTCIIWLAFASTFFFTNNNIVRVLSLCITLSINSTVSLCVLFLSRLYIILFKPRLNTRERVMTRGNEKSDRTSKCLTANKSVGTEESSDEYVYTKNGLLAATSTSVPNLAPFESKTKKQFISGAHSVHNISILNNLGEENAHSRKTRDIPLKDLPRITISNGETEFNV
ncbi:unnamed protein product [Mytilus edulis]|uniref:G-protein coupled receptors family 3 profile domain-containing protein n=1 Tax=Mytilus edulis TaxID=6550 RepID=A0A8S3SF82_MYTED|nr:unnamed protein product [Mytilus edulis]